MAKTRCEWGTVSQLYIDYHDNEWGVPVHDDRKLFEFLILEGAQAGLSWETVLKKREGYRKAFSNFDPVKVSRYGDKKIEALMGNKGIIRNRLKITSAINNAKRFLEVQKEFGSFDSYIWQFVDGKTITNRFKSVQEIPATTEVSDAMSKDLKKRGFKFVGPTICYAHMQATGMVNDHVVGCFRYKEIKGTHRKGAKSAKVKKKREGEFSHRLSQTKKDAS
ncbi:MAG: DNA-3-methyladenine glycosylase I [Candidatus Scalindua sp.]|nr:DNA-3-methyladenine glycosylase I [Candidatus Scalindua sp.]